MRVSLWWYAVYQRNNCCLYMHHRMDEARDKAPLLILMVVSLWCRWVWPAVYQFTSVHVIMRITGWTKLSQTKWLCTVCSCILYQHCTWTRSMFPRLRPAANEGPLVHVFHYKNNGTVFRTKRPGPARTLKIPVYCYCRCADDGQGMVGCDGCEDW